MIKLDLLILEPIFLPVIHQQNFNAKDALCKALVDESLSPPLNLRIRGDKSFKNTLNFLILQNIKCKYIFSFQSSFLLFNDHEYMINLYTFYSFWPLTFNQPLEDKPLRTDMSLERNDS